MRGFSLLEMIAVMAIMAIFAGVLAPAVFKTIDQAVAEAEATSLETLGDSLLSYVKEQRRIPSWRENRWSQAIADQSSYTTEQVIYNDRGFKRGVYFDPRFLSTSNQRFPGVTQDLGLLTAPNSPRVLIVSDLTADAPAAPRNRRDFNRIWDADPNAAVIESPDVKIVRMHLGSLFHRIVLTNDNGAIVSFQVEGGSMGSIPAASGSPGEVVRYIVDGSQLRLFSETHPAGTLLANVVVREPLSYHYRTDGAIWSWQKP